GATTHRRIERERARRVDGISSGARRALSPDPVARSRIPLFVAVVALVAAAADARPPCRLDPVTVPVCAGSGAAASAHFCFDAACDQPGTITGVTPPDAPFVVAALHVDG